MIKQSSIMFGLAGALSLAACNIDVPDLNNAGLDDLQNNPNATLVNAAATGLLINDRGNIATENGYIDQLGIIGREAYNFDAADGRYVGELLGGSLNRASPFGGGFWTLPFNTIRTGNIILAGVGKVKDFSADPAETAAAVAGVTGFTHTLQALAFLQIINTHDTDGAPIDVDTDINKPPAPFVSKEKVFAHINDLLDKSATELAAAGDAFSFPLGPGYAGFSTPESFTTFNRAIRARVAVYEGDYATAATALDASFIDDDDANGRALNFQLGVFHSFSIGAGDTANQLTNPNIYANPILRAQAEDGDKRFAAKVVVADQPGAAGGLSGADQFTMYTDPGRPVPLIRNEELILLRAEVLAHTGTLAEATTELNKVRTGSGGLPALNPPADLAAFTTALLHERQYSLMFEGHRWIDVRRLVPADQIPTYLPRDRPKDVINLRYPVPTAECDARGGATVELACALDTTGADGKTGGQ